MSLFYDETSVKANFTGSIKDFDASDMYLRHYDNLLMLTFFHQNGTTLEKLQASKEIDICERKLNFWRRQENYDKSRVEKGIASLKARWK